jgi:hypothetical protein
LIIDGKLFDIIFLVLLGNDITTPLSFSDFIFTSKIEIIPDTTNGLLTLYGECNLPNRLLNYDASFKLYLATSNPVTGVSEFVIDIPSLEETELSLFNSMGTKVKTIVSGYLNPGKYNYSYNSEDLSDGIYFVRLRNGRWVTNLKVIVLH